MALIALKKTWFFTSVVSDGAPTPSFTMSFDVYYATTAAVPPSTEPTPSGLPASSTGRSTLLKSTWAILAPALGGTGDPVAAMLAAQTNETNANPNTAMGQLSLISDASRIGVANPIARLAALNALLAA